MHNKLVIFDIETVIDCEAGRRLLNLPQEMSDAEVIKNMEDYHLQITDGKNKFIRQPFHKIVAISFLSADIERTAEGEKYILTEVRSGGKLDSSEKELVAGFFSYLKAAKPRLVTFNGRTFDVPVLKYRAMVHGIDAKWYYQMGDKWNNYGSRYSLDWHCDLIEAFSDFGTSARVKMNELCAAFSIPGKLDVDGAQVQTLFDEGNLQEIRDYCELDVISTYLLYLKYAQHTGLTSSDNATAAQEDLISYLESNPRDNFNKYLDAYYQAN